MIHFDSRKVINFFSKFFISKQKPGLANTALQHFRKEDFRVVYAKCPKI